MSERKIEPKRDRPLTFLHKLSRHVINSGNMISVRGMAESKGISDQSCSQQNRIISKSDERPRPASKIYRAQKTVESDDLFSEASNRLIHDDGDFRQANKGGCD